MTVLALWGYAMGLPLWRRLSPTRRNALRILRYHSVSATRRHETVVTPEVFRRHMRWLKGYGDGRDPDYFITLDDGYADNARGAYAILREEGMKAIVFLIAGYVGTDRLLPHDEGGIVEDNRLMRWEEARRCDPGVMEFGSHGWSHQRMALLSDEQLQQEAADSKAVIEKEIGRPVRFFSYPFGVDGDYDSRAKEAVRRAGFEAAFNAKYGENLEGGDPYDLYRIGVEASDTLFTLRAKLNGALDLMRLAESAWGRRWVRRCNRWLRA